MNKLLLFIILGLLWLSCSNLSNPFDSKSANFVPESTLVSYSNHLQGRDSVIVLDTFIFRDTIHDSILHIDTTFIIDTTRVIDSLHIIDTSFVFDTTTILDTLLHLDTIVSIDTIHFRDTTVFLDTVPVFDTLHFKDTTLFLDTFTVLDTTIYYDTLIQRDTVHFRDTLRFLDTLHFRDTILTFDTSIVLDTLFHLDTIISTDTLHILDTTVVTLYSYDTLLYFDTLTHFDTVWSYDTLHLFDTVVTHVFDTLVYYRDTIHHYDTSLYFDSLPYIRTLDFESLPTKIAYGRLPSYACTLYHDPCCFNVRDTLPGTDLMFYFRGGIGGGADSTDLRVFSYNPANNVLDMFNEIAGWHTKLAFYLDWIDTDCRTFFYFIRFYSTKYHCWTPYYKISVIVKKGPKP